MPTVEDKIKFGYFIETLESEAKKHMVFGLDDDDESTRAGKLAAHFTLNSIAKALRQLE